MVLHVQIEIFWSVYSVHCTLYRSINNTHEEKKQSYTHKTEWFSKLLSQNFQTDFNTSPFCPVKSMQKSRYEIIEFSVWCLCEKLCIQKLVFVATFFGWYGCCKFVQFEHNSTWDAIILLLIEVSLIKHNFLEISTKLNC